MNVDGAVKGPAACPRLLGQIVLGHGFGGVESTGQPIQRPLDPALDLEAELHGDGIDTDH